MHSVWLSIKVDRTWRTAENRESFVQEMCQAISTNEVTFRSCFSGIFYVTNTILGKEMPRHVSSISQPRTELGLMTDSLSEVPTESSVTISHAGSSGVTLRTGQIVEAGKSLAH